jgi:hypothetical protein
VRTIVSTCSFTSSKVTNFSHVVISSFALMLERYFSSYHLNLS